jgi:cytochrome P450
VQESGAKWDTALETQLCFEIKTFLLAGHETSAAMLTWSTYELSLHEEAARKVSSFRGHAGDLVVGASSLGKMGFGKVV